MKQLQLVRVQVTDLVQGMYVAELDRPWLGSPFVLEGFLLEDPEQLEQLRELCTFVKVDASRSHDACRGLLMATGELQAPPKARNAKVPRRVHVATASLVEASQARNRQAAPENSLFSDLRTIVTETLQPAVAQNLNTQAPSQGGAWRVGRARRAGGLRKLRLVPPGRGTILYRGTPSRPEVTYINSVGNAARPLRKGKLFPYAHRMQVGLDSEADQEQLGGSVLILPRGRVLTASPELEEATRIHARTRLLVAEFFKDVAEQRSLDLDAVGEVIAEMSDSITDNPDPLIWLSHLKHSDDYAYKHAIDCAVHLMSFGRYLGYARETLQTLGMAGLLLDVGKIRVPKAIRDNTERLSAAKYAEMQKHVAHSIDILHHDIQGLADKQRVLEIVAQHHERMDGSGYPLGLSGKDIHPLASMAGIVDAYAAMVTPRPHAPAISIHKAMLAIDQRKTREFNDSLVEQFIQCVGLYPVGSVVELNTGEVGVVVSQNRVRRLKPSVMLLLDSNKQPYPYPGVVNLLLDPPAFDDTPYAIVTDVPPDRYNIDATEFYLKAS